MKTMSMATWSSEYTTNVQSVAADPGPRDVSASNVHLELIFAIA